MAYIPKQHEKYGLLPFCRVNGGEVFSYPTELVYEIENLLSQGESLTPYGYSSYQEYDSVIEKCRAKYAKEGSKLDLLLTDLKVKIHAMNIKEDWVVARYLGEKKNSVFGLTSGRCYYWPCSKEHPVYEGVVDDEEFTSYQYPTNPELWEVLEDPLGMTKFMREKE